MEHRIELLYCPVLTLPVLPFELRLCHLGERRLHPLGGKRRDGIHGHLGLLKHYKTVPFTQRPVTVNDGLGRDDGAKGFA